ncbi:MAG: D-amino-acid transaminase [Acetobacteraceae bacterium]|nr:D-amino-acid transaminase [Acetobacteraceae bacterium]
MSRVAYVNGRYLPQRAAVVNIEDRAVQFADSIYEVVHFYNARFIDEQGHLGRLERSLREISLTCPISPQGLRQVLREVAARNRLTHGLLYIQISRGVARRDHAFPTQPTRPTLVVSAKRLPAYPATPDAWAVRAITYPDHRWGRCDIKATGLLPNVLARQAARTQGAAEAILIDRDEMVTEGAATTVWMVDQSGALRTRPLDHAILPGCTREALAALLRDAGIDFEERAFSKAELYSASEIFLTGATSFVKPVVQLDNFPVGEGITGPVTRHLFELFARHVGTQPG